jgi:hypothetical protein
MEQAELKGAIDTMKAQEPPAPPSVLPDAQTQGNHIERVPQFKAADPRGPLLHAGKKVAILGFTDSFKQAPFADPTWEIWGLNELYMLIPRWSRWFEIHSRDVYEADKKRTSDHIYALRAMTVPVYMHKHEDDIPMSVPYPLQAIAQAFPSPGGGRPYLTNSISYMIALAIMEGFTEIAVYGVDMAHSTEYGHQKPSCEYWLGIAQGRGIKVTIPPDCELLFCNFLYGFEQEQLERWNARMTARKADLNKKLSEIDAQIANASEARAQYRGALQDVDHLLNNWEGLVRAT